jgi:hypothetical protein
MIELLLFILATSAFLFWLGEQREGAALGGAATGFAAIVAIIFIIYMINQLK